MNQIHCNLTVTAISYCDYNYSLLCAQIGNENNTAFSKIISQFGQIPNEGTLSLTYEIQLTQTELIVLYEYCLFQQQ